MKKPIQIIWASEDKSVELNPTPMFRHAEASVSSLMSLGQALSINTLDAVNAEVD